MTAPRHAAVSVVLAAGCALAWRSPAAAVAAFAGGTLLDLDHWFDWSWNDSGPFSVDRFVRLCNQYRLPRFFLLAHSVEWLVPFWLVVVLVPVPPWTKALALGLAVHMCMDMAGNGMRLPAYSFLYRWRHGFDSRAFVLRLPPEALGWWGSLAAYRRGRAAAGAGGVPSGEAYRRRRRPA